MKYKTQQRASTAQRSKEKKGSYESEDRNLGITQSEENERKKKRKTE